MEGDTSIDEASVRTIAVPKHPIPPYKFEWPKGRLAESILTRCVKKALLSEATTRVPGQA
jgi:hypothetical protein